MLVLERAIHRYDAGCVQAAVACSAELQAKYGYKVRTLIVMFHKRGGSIDERILRLS
jgi:hypothetical protein